MKRIGIVSGIAVLGLLSWVIWTKGGKAGDFVAWEETLLTSYQYLDPEAVSRYRAGSVSSYVSFSFQLKERDQEQLVREKAFWQEKRSERLTFDPLSLDSLARSRWEALKYLEARFVDLPAEWYAMRFFHPEDGLQSELLLLLTHLHHIASVDDCEGYVYRLRTLPLRFREALAATEQAAATGWVMDSLSLRIAVEQLRTLAEMPVKELILYRTFGTRITRLDPTAINEYQAVEFLLQAAKTLEEDFQPTLLLVADRLAALTPSAPGMDRLPEPIFDTWLSTMIFRDSLPAGWRESLQQAFDRVPPLFLPPLRDKVRLNQDSILKQIRSSTEGILATYPAESIRLREQPKHLMGLRPQLLSGTRDGMVFPVLLLPEEGDPYETTLDIYQYAIPGAGLQRQLLVESEQPMWQLAADHRAAEEGWGRYGLSLLQDKLLWFSRDSLLLQAYEQRAASGTVLAWLDWQLHDAGRSLPELTAFLLDKGHDPEQIRRWQQVLLLYPGHSLAVYFWEIWGIQHAY